MASNQDDRSGELKSAKTGGVDKSSLYRTRKIRAARRLKGRVLVLIFALLALTPLIYVTLLPDGPLAGILPWGDPDSQGDGGSLFGKGFGRWVDSKSGL